MHIRNIRNSFYDPGDPAWGAWLRHDSVLVQSDLRSLEKGRMSRMSFPVFCSNRRVGGKGEVSLYCRFLKPGTGDFSADGKLIYQTDSKPVITGKYRLQLNGKRLGNILYGKVTITGPDGKETVRQFLGDVESVGKP